VNGNLTMQGPVMLLQGFKGAVARIPVFITNVTQDEFFG
jgi:sensor domain CHASE-containing protein